MSTPDDYSEIGVQITAGFVAMHDYPELWERNVEMAVEQLKAKVAEYPNFEPEGGPWIHLYLTQPVVRKEHP